MQHIDLLNLSMHVFFSISLPQTQWICFSQLDWPKKQQCIHVYLHMKGKKLDPIIREHWKQIPGVNWCTWSCPLMIGLHETHVIARSEWAWLSVWSDIGARFFIISSDDFHFKNVIFSAWNKCQCLPVTTWGQNVTFQFSSHSHLSDKRVLRFIWLAASEVSSSWRL